MIDDPHPATDNHQTMNCTKHIIYLVLLLLTQQSIAQQYKTQIMPPIKKLGTINMSDASRDFFPSWRSITAASPSGKTYQDFLERQKLKSAKRFPRKEIIQSNYRDVADDPLIIKDFRGNASNTGVPLDNHIAVSNAGRIVSVINTNISIYDELGNRITTRSLNGFSSEITTKSQFQFDPRVMYDQEADRFILCFISGFACNTSEIVLAFSQTNNPSGNWHLYILDGCPFDNNTFADYPMMAITQKEFFLTINAVKENVSWQEGFDETLIWQIDKQSAYEGQELLSRLWSDVAFEGRNIRNVCPVKAGDQLKGDNLYLLSNRNFDIQNDSFFLLEISSTWDDPNSLLSVEALVADQAYGLAPNAIQKFGFLATNDSRVLDAFYENNQIQFVMNSIDTARGTAAIYHGIIDGVNTNKQLTGKILTNGKDDFAYPGISYTGMAEADEDALIVLEHSSRIRNVGWSAIYFDNDRNYSEIKTVKEGSGYINVNEEGLERWGDYIGIQRKYSQPGFVWAASTHGTSNKRYATWIAKIARPDVDLTPVENPSQFDNNINVFPNPTSDILTIQFELKSKATIALLLFDVNGKEIKRFFDEQPKQTGLQQFSFSTAPLAQGIYLLSLKSEGQQILTKKIIVKK